MSNIFKFSCMIFKKKPIITVILVVMCVLLHWYAADENRVEIHYSLSIFPAVSNFLRLLFGFLPFSIGDLLYGAAVVFLMIKIFQLFRFFLSQKRRENYRQKILPALFTFINTLCIIYLVFNLFWGINYNRKGIAAQIGLEIKDYTVDDLTTINGILAEKVNSCKAALIKSAKPYPGNKELFAGVVKAYKNAAVKYPFLNYSHPSLKSSMWGWVGNYTGFTGYYNPFTGEAQVNTTVPKFTQPYTACHEAAHSIGYAKEMEANFTGYLAAVASDDTLFHYSVYTDLFLYANRSLYFADTAASSFYRKQLSPGVVADFKERSKFNRDHSSFLEPVIRVIYGKYLESNGQPKGIWSYDEVTAFIISYYKKFGTI